MDGKPDTVTETVAEMRAVACGGKVVAGERIGLVGEQTGAQSGDDTALSSSDKLVNRPKTSIGRAKDNGAAQVGVVVFRNP